MCIYTCIYLVLALTVPELKCYRVILAQNIGNPCSLIHPISDNAYDNAILQVDQRQLSPVFLGCNAVTIYIPQPELISHLVVTAEVGLYELNRDCQDHEECHQTDHSVEADVIIDGAPCSSSCACALLRKRREVEKRLLNYFCA